MIQFTNNQFELFPSISSDLPLLLFGGSLLLGGVSYFIYLLNKEESGTINDNAFLAEAETLFNDKNVQTEDILTQQVEVQTLQSQVIMGIQTEQDLEDIQTAIDLELLQIKVASLKSQISELTKTLSTIVGRKTVSVQTDNEIFLQEVTKIIKEHLKKTQAITVDIDIQATTATMDIDVQAQATTTEMAIQTPRELLIDELRTFIYNAYTPSDNRTSMPWEEYEQTYPLQAIKFTDTIREWAENLLFVDNDIITLGIPALPSPADIDTLVDNTPTGTDLLIFEAMMNNL